MCTKIFQNGRQRGVLKNGGRGTHKVFQIPLSASNTLLLLQQDVAGVHHTQNFVGIAPLHGQPRHARGRGKAGGRGAVGIAVEPFHTLTRNHDKARRAPAKADNPGNHVPFLGGKKLPVGITRQGCGFQLGLTAAGYAAAQQVEDHAGR